MPDEGRIEWAKNIKVGYLDQHSVLEKGMTIGSVMRQAFDDLFVMEERMNEICDKMMDADDEQMTEYMEELGTIQDMLTNHDFYMIDAKVEEVARALGLLELGLDKDVTDLSGGQRTKVLLGKLLLEKPDILLLDEPTNYLDKEHIDWLKRYLLDYENAFILISHDIPFLNSVINIIYHMDNQQLNRYVGDYYKFQEVYEMKQAQMKAAYDKQQKESTLENIIILCGHYKGIDHRIREHLVTREISIGDYVLTGGELAACIIADSVVRIIPGAIGDEASALTDSFQDNLLAPPVYTRPAEFRGWRVPDVLLSGNFAQIARWQDEQSLERTRQLRPDLLGE